MKLKPYVLYLFVLSIFLSCTEKETYFQYFELKKGEWSKYDTLYYDIDSASVITNVPMNVEIELTNNSEYLYRNIWLYIQDDFAGNLFQKYEKQYQLCDEFGKWYGAGYGSLYQLSLIYKENVIFEEKRNYRIKLVHGMRDEPLIGIEKTGIKIYPRSE